MRARTFALSAALVVLGAAHANAQDMDCRRAAAACSDGFSCVQVGDAWECVPEGPQPEVRAVEQPTAVSDAFPDGLATDAEPGWLHGRWSLDVSRTLDAQEMTAEERQMAEAFMGSMQMYIDFEADGSMSMEAVIFGETQRESGTWSGTSQGELIVVSSTTTGEDGTMDTTSMEIDFASRDVFAARETGSGEVMYFSRTP